MEEPVCQSSIQARQLPITAPEVRKKAAFAMLLMMTKRPGRGVEKSLSGAIATLNGRIARQTVSGRENRAD
ncbi:hypothetical protein [Franconibacter helveticus]|uniref:hypothetical protein n=1 Tax=Franconibacter helveticus TaxID=357240 RepID=UPI00066D6259|nr:hypothetical protein [Franconibacter helveticus]